MTLRTRLTVAVTAIVAVAVIGAAYASHYSTRQQLRSETDTFLRQRVERYLRAAPPPGGAPGNRLRGGDGGPRPNEGPPDPGGGFRPPVELDAVTQTLDADGSILGTTGGPTLPVGAADRALAASPGPLRLRNVRAGGVHYRVLSAHQATGGGVQIGRALTEPDDVLAVLRDRLVLIALAGTLFAAAMAWALARRTARPIAQLTETAERVATTQDLGTPIGFAGTDEVGRLAESFNTMLTALATSKEQQQRLVADASHELRTPLTALRTNIEFLERAESLPTTERAALLAEARAELVELTSLVAELVELAGDAPSDEPTTAVDLGDVAHEVAVRFRRRSGRDIAVTIDRSAVIDGRRSMIERAVSNLVDNAIKFSSADTAVDITVDGARVEVADRGPGIPVAERARVFDRFYRATVDRTKPGSGLGLAIVHQIATAHGGAASMHERPGGGAVARLEFFDNS